MAFAGQCKGLFHSHRPLTAAIAVGLIAGLSAGCGSDEVVAEEVDDSIIPQVPVPAADGPKLTAVTHQLVVRDRPSAAGKPLGTLRAGAQVARAAEPYSTKGCSGGWYPIRPQGFVCAGHEATVDESPPVATTLAEPALERPLPYRYGRVLNGGAVVYGTLPSGPEQLTAEPKLRSRTAAEPEVLGTGANDVPLDENFLPTGPPVLRPEAEGISKDGRRTTADYFLFGTESPPLTVGASLIGSSKTEVLKRSGGVAITSSLKLGQDGRRFGAMPDGRFVPIDRLEPALGTAWHGLELSKDGLPVAFTIRDGVCPYELVSTKSTKRLDDEELVKGEIVRLTGRFRTVNRQRFFATVNDKWMRHKDIILIPKRNKFPDWATPTQKWLDISVANQTLVAWEGRKPLYATLISSGKDRLGDPSTGPATAQGVFRFRRKAITGPVDDREVGQAYRIHEAPWVAELDEGVAITGAYWLGSFGEAQSYHNVALAPIDAHWLWHWSDPKLPEGWHSVHIEENAPSTIVYIHK